MHILIIGFFDDKTHHTFGVIKKDIYRPLSDFNFDYLMKVKANKACSTGYMIKVTPENIQRARCNNEDTQNSSSEDEDEVSSRFVARSL